MKAANFEIQNGTLKKYREDFRHVTVPDGVTEIGRSAFFGSEFYTLTIPEGVKKIGAYAFCQCEQMEKIHLPSTVTEIDGSAFEHCPSLEQIIVAPGNPALCSEGGVLYNKDKTKLICYPRSIFTSEEVLAPEVFTVPNGVTDIDAYAFFGCRSLREILLPDSVEHIGRDAFSVSHLKKIRLSRRLKKMGRAAFLGCEKLQSVQLPDSLKTLEGEVFAFCKQLQVVKLPKRLTSVGRSAFEDCKALKSIVLPQTLKSIENSAFNGCYLLNSVNIPHSVTELGTHVFGGCNHMEWAKVGNGVKTLPEATFGACFSMETISLPAGLTAVETHVFSDCAALKTVRFGGSKEQHEQVHIDPNGNIMLSEHKDDGKDEYRQEINEMLSRLATGANAIVQDKYITLTIQKKTVDDARQHFRRVSTDLQAHFGRLGSKCRELDLTERLRVLHDFCRPGEEADYHFDLRDTMRKGQDFRDYISPDSYAFKSDHFRIGDKFARVLFIRDYPSYIKDSVIMDLTDNNRSMIFNYDIIPVSTEEAQKFGEKQALGIETNIANYQRRQREAYERHVRDAEERKRALAERRKQRPVPTKRREDRDER